MTSQQPKSLLNFFLTGPMPCPYLPGKHERNLFTELGDPLSTATKTDTHEQLTRAGFRRSHTVVYRPACPDCSACVPVRVPVSDFRPSRSLRRIRNRNRDLRVKIVAPDPTREHFELFSRYQKGRHAGGDMAAMSYGDYEAMVIDMIGQTRIFEFRDAAGTLVAACLADQLHNALSAVYSFFAPELEERGLGSQVVLALIDHAKSADLAHVYLGYWIEASPKMSYKTRFQPLEALGPAGWEILEPARAHPLE